MPTKHNKDILNAITNLSLADPTLSNKQIADKLGISKTSVYDNRKRSHENPATSKVTQDEVLAVNVHRWLMAHRQEVTLDELSDKFDIGITRVRNILAYLKSQAKNVEHISDTRIGVVDTHPASPPTKIDVSKFKGKTIKFGLTADNHLASKYARNEVLEALYDIWEDQGIDTVYQAGNMIEGDAPFNKFDVIVTGLQAQTDYFIDNWPRRKGMTTYFVTGEDHEGWAVRREGVNIAQFMELCSHKAGRNDLQFLGHMEHDIIFTGKQTSSTMRIIHAGGGSSYATSYAPQKIVESYQGSEKPNILLIGHYHKAEYGYPREVHVVQAACTKDQDTFMRKLKLQAHIGGWTISFDVDANGIIHGFTPQFHPFYDRAFYENPQWEYLWKERKMKAKKY